MAAHRLPRLVLFGVLMVMLLMGCTVLANARPAGKRAAKVTQAAGTPEPFIVEKRVAAKGEELEVRLEGNVTTGYSWQVAEIDEKAVQQVSEEYVESEQGDKQVVGSGGTFVFRFRALAEGQSKIKMVYQRSWEKDAEPLRTYTLELTVR